jgi:virginiamycin B lyase
MLTRIFVVFCLAAASAIAADDTSTAALTGVVSSQEEGPMAGVLVSAKRAGATITTTVVSDARGRYSFPRNRLDPGQYSIRVRAAGYELDGPRQAEVTGQKESQTDLNLRKAQDLAYQLSSGEWLASMPGTEQQKQFFLNCVGCHTLERSVRSRYTANEFVQVIQRMAGYAQGSTPLRPQKRLDDREYSPRQLEQMTKQGEFVSSVNLSSVSRWEYPLKTLPRPSGKAARVIITEYDLPRPEALPHDAAVDSQGSVWYTDFGSQYLGKLDSKTGKISEYKLPLTKPGAATGSLDLGVDAQGNIWMGMMYQGAFAKFDRETEKFQTWFAPKYKENPATRVAMVAATSFNVDGKVWVGADDEYQVDLKTGEWQAIDYSKGLPKGAPPADRLSSYGVIADSHNNFYGMNLNGEYIIRVDAKTRNVTPYATPTPNSGPRRGHMDSQDRLWFAEYRGNRIGMLDTKTEKIQEWLIPTPWTNPYDTVLDRAGNAWTGGMTNDRIVRLNTANGEFTEYLLPRTTNVRRVNVDNSTNPPTFWVGNNLGNTIIKLEPLE